MSVSSAQKTNLEYLFSELRRVTSLLAHRFQELVAAGSAEEDEFKGLYVTEEEVNQLLTDPTLFLPGDYQTEPEVTPTVELMQRMRLAHLQKVLGLSVFELNVLLIALAPELSLRFEKIFAYLQDDVTRRRPNVDLILRLLCPSPAAQITARRCFDSDAPLLRYRLIELGEETQNRQNSLLSRTIKLDEGVIAYLLGESRLDVRLRGLVELSHITHAIQLPLETASNIQRLVELGQDNIGFVCVLAGTDLYTKTNIAEDVCKSLGMQLLVVDCTQIPIAPKTDGFLRLLERESKLQLAPLFFADFDYLLREDQVAQETCRAVERLLAEQTGITFVSIEQQIPPLLAGKARRVITIQLGLPGYSERQHLWETLLGNEAAGLDLEGLSSRFRLSSGQILAAAITARNTAAWKGQSYLTMEDLELACRRHSNQRLNSVAHKITPLYRWDDLVLPADQSKMLREITAQVKHRSLVYEKWGFERKLSLGKGLNVIFAGQSGTGKTMSAEIIAGELRMDLYKIDLSNVVSKYIGETEKNLERIFTEAGESNAILFFDEADSIFGKRSEVKDAHDRYANIETGYLLQKMDEYEGIVILATNLRKNLDEAFVRRMHFVIEYPFPEEEDRYQIWSRVFPKEMPLAESVDLRFMARQFKIAGGNIKNIALTAAFLAASDGSDAMVEMLHLIRATRREFQKMGKLITETDFGQYYKWISEVVR
ncbi:MAG: ATP-binding protein [Chloroflexi bacterium]|uniref:AAA family ATPase n=1 Tax=Candidatus Chlorohelix allophototropha TaxID=3003348 RepID=A0A8T7LX64_9CHLR|nr:ATP-binding protein [Chloroflexota bacterium]WJW67426.1 AAA family ATPase [Chloroflexota bacterium L227-S17]